MELGFHSSHKEPNLHVGFAPEQETDWWSMLRCLPVQIKLHKMRQKAKQCNIYPTETLKTSEEIQLSTLKNWSAILCGRS